MLESVLTAMLMLVILAVSTGPKEKGLIAGAAIGATVGLEAMFAGPVSGASMNPARSIGPATRGRVDSALWVYIAGPLAVRRGGGGDSPIAYRTGAAIAVLKKSAAGSGEACPASYKRYCLDSPIRAVVGARPARLSGPVPRRSERERDAWRPTRWCDARPPLFSQARWPQSPRPAAHFFTASGRLTILPRLYGLPDWGKGYFGVNPLGHLTVIPTKEPGKQIDLHEVVAGLRERGIHTPVLLRFNDILAHRLREIRRGLRRRHAEHGYTGGYSCVYPIKVNQQRHVVEQIARFGVELGFGLEAGSKPELLAVLGRSPAARRNGMPIICNGFKDDEFIETVILATKLGSNIIPVVEKFTELELIVKHAKELQRPPEDRRARQARQPRRRPMGRLRRLPLQVRPDRLRGAQAVEYLKSTRHG